MRVIITLACGNCKQRNYTSTKKNKRNNPDRIEMKKNIADSAIHKLLIAKPGSFGGVTVAFFLGKMKQSFSFFGDAYAELKKVKWPSRKEMTSYTLVVLSAIAFIAVYFAILDLGISELLRLVTK